LRYALGKLGTLKRPESTENELGCLGIHLAAVDQLCDLGQVLNLLCAAVSHPEIVPISKDHCGSKGLG
jgi:hypothetical protein